jgi:hypothetical protein
VNNFGLQILRWLTKVAFSSFLVSAVLIYVLSLRGAINVALVDLSRISSSVMLIF